MAKEYEAKTRNMLIRIPIGLHARLRNEAFDKNVSMARIVRRALKFYLGEQ